MSNLPLGEHVGTGETVSEAVAELVDEGFDELLANSKQHARRWGKGHNHQDLVKLHGSAVSSLPICPYGCGRAGTLLEIVMGADGRALGIFNDHPCTCVFVAEIQLGEPPTKRKMVIGADGELQEAQDG